MKLRSITNKDYDSILRMDKKVYPTDSPVTKEIISSWYINNPEFGMIYEENNQTVGTCVVIPLNMAGWKGLINNNRKESEMNEETIFNNSRDNEIGIHFYHIEKIEPVMNIFYRKALKDLSGIINNLKEKNKKLKICGFSALAVSKEGIGLAERVANFKERDYKCPEHVFEKEGKLAVFDSSNNNFKETANQDYNLVTRCKMLVLYPEEKSPIWKYFK